jgi:hypothetical protein
MRIFVLTLDNSSGTERHDYADRSYLGQGCLVTICHMARHGIIMISCTTGDRNLTTKLTRSYGSAPLMVHQWVPGLPSHDRAGQAERSTVLPSAGVVDPVGPDGLPGKDGRWSSLRTCRHGRLTSSLHPAANRSNPPSRWLAGHGVLRRQPPRAQEPERGQRGRKQELLTGSAATLRARGTGSPEGRRPPSPAGTGIQQPGSGNHRQRRGCTHSPRRGTPCCLTTPPAAAPRLHAWVSAPRTGPRGAIRSAVSASSCG